ncbi:MAG: sigma-70 family RNA polymerase sigma factor [Bacteroidales bacterium]|nr:sigma-70 family RNA polymerase sigma factor [Bacteroidales bacterium]
MTLEERQKEFVEIVKQHERLILKVCALYSDAGSDGLKDLYQEAVCALWEAYPSYRGDSRLSTWIFSVTRFTILNQIRKNRLKIIPLESEHEMVAAHSETTIATEELRSALERLQTDEKDMMVMWLEGFDLDEIASAVGMKYGAVATRLTRIKMKLKAMMNPNK